MVDDILYVGGIFTDAGGVQDTKNIAAIDVQAPTTWTSLGSATAEGGGGIVNAITYQAGAVYIGGSFTRIGNLQFRNFARYDPGSTSWSSPGAAGPNGVVYALTTYD